MDNRRIANRTPVYDHAGEKLGDFSRDRILELLNCVHVLVQGSQHRITSLRFIGPDPSGLELSGSRRRRQIGSPHKHENYYNPAGCWHLDRIPRPYRPHFEFAQLVTYAA